MGNDLFGVGIKFNKDGVSILKKIYLENIGKQIGLFIDNVPISAPTIKDKFSGDSIVIGNNFTEQEALNFMHRLQGYYYTK